MEKPASLRRIGKTTEKTAFEPLPGSSSTFRKVYGQASSQKPLSPDVQEDNFVATTCLSDILLSASKEINNSIDQYVKDQRKEEHDYQYTSSESQPEEVASATLDKETSSSPQRFSDGDLSEFLNFLAKEQLLDVLQHVVTKLLEQLISASTARGGSVSDLSYGSSSDGSNPSRPGGNSLDFLRFLTKETSLSEMLSSQLSGFSGGISPMNSSDIMSRKWPLPGPYDRTKGYSTSSSDLKSENWYQNNSGQYRAKREKPKGMCNQFPPLPSKVKSSKPLKKELDPLQIQEIKVCESPTVNMAAYRLDNVPAIPEWLLFPDTQEDSLLTTKCLSEIFLTVSKDLDKYLDQNMKELREEDSSRSNSNYSSQLKGKMSKPLGEPPFSCSKGFSDAQFTECLSLLAKEQLLDILQHVIEKLIEELVNAILANVNSLSDATDSESFPSKEATLSVLKVLASEASLPEKLSCLSIGGFEGVSPMNSFDSMLRKWPSMGPCDRAGNYSAVSADFKSEKSYQSSKGPCEVKMDKLKGACLNQLPPPSPKNLPSKLQKNEPNILPEKVCEPPPVSKTVIRNNIQVNSQKLMYSDTQEGDFNFTSCLSEILFSANRNFGKSTGSDEVDRAKEESKCQYSSDDRQPEREASVTLEETMSSCPLKGRDTKATESLNQLAKEQLLATLQNVIRNLIEELVSAKTASTGPSSEKKQSSGGKRSSSSLDILRSLSKEINVAKKLNVQSYGCSEAAGSDTAPRKWTSSVPYDRTANYSTASSDFRSEKSYQRDKKSSQEKRDEPTGKCPSARRPRSARFRSSKPQKKESDPLQKKVCDSPSVTKMVYRSADAQGSSQRILPSETEEDSCSTAPCLSELLLSTSKEYEKSTKENTKDQKKAEKRCSNTRTERQPGGETLTISEEASPSFSKSFSDSQFTEFLNFLAQEQILDVLQHVVRKLLEEIISTTLTNVKSLSDPTSGPSSDGNALSKVSSNSLDILKLFAMGANSSAEVNRQSSKFSERVSPVNSLEVMARKRPLSGNYDRIGNYSMASSDFTEKSHQKDGRNIQAKREKTPGMGLNQFPPLSSKTRLSKQLKKECDDLSKKRTPDYPPRRETSLQRMMTYTRYKQTTCSGQQQLQQTPEEEIKSIFEAAFALMVLKDRKEQELCEKTGCLINDAKQPGLKESTLKSLDRGLQKEDQKDRIQASEDDTHPTLYQLQGHTRGCQGTEPQCACPNKTNVLLFQHKPCRKGRTARSRRKKLNGKALQEDVVWKRYDVFSEN